ncbi:MAG: thioredoxin fold domain-containing protein [Deltaproteobacteria bacterium]|nr:thioredoxin fold domain-containing protein [Deltaproteobacteria bacterium]MBW2049265.1 thioredoxin fold domain-containing protein [Deltaproteobacteria bacterium]MBW2111961.1 thioredoxin fold domain-containing protein [Deltaproteobacteria bacterium]MBW2353837.1 thioredoxin fold domain-containing protein [Deltaproteobacteria bacterium]HDZ91656.1 thiol reductase thioredoxin [Deltaproteobacteria bacterium]
MEIREIRSGDDFRETIKEGVTLADFNAPWCAPCRTQEPILEGVAHRFEKKASVVAMNVDENRDLAMNLGIRSIPTLIIFKDSKEIERFVGVQPEAVLSGALEKALK